MNELTDEERANFEKVRSAHPTPVPLPIPAAKPLIAKGRLVQAAAGGRGKSGTYRLSPAYAAAEVQASAAEGPGIGHNLAPEIDFDELASIIEDLNDSKDSISEATGRYRSAIKRVLEDREWNKTAFGDILKIERMSETSRADYLRSFLMLLAVMRAGAWDGELVDMVAKMEAGESDEDPDAGDDGDADGDGDGEDTDGEDGDAEGDEDPDDDGGEVAGVDDGESDVFGDQIEGLGEEVPEPELA